MTRRPNNWGVDNIFMVNMVESTSCKTLAAVYEKMAYDARRTSG